MQYQIVPLNFKLPDGTYRPDSSGNLKWSASSGGATNTITLTREGSWICDCPNYNRSRFACDHVDAVYAFHNQDLVRWGGRGRGGASIKEFEKPPDYLVNAKRKINLPEDT